MRKVFSKVVGMKKMVPMLFVAVCLFPLSGHAEIKAGSVEISPFAGYNFFENSQNLKNRPAFGGRIGYNFTNHFGIEAGGEYIRSRVDDRSLSFSKEGQFTSPIEGVDISMYHLDLIYHFMPEAKFNPFLIAGYGIAHYSPSINSRNMSVIDFGAGAKYWIADNIALRLDVRDNLVTEFFQESFHNVQTTLGVVFRFGGKGTAVPVTELKPEPIPPQPVIKEETRTITEPAEAPLEPIPAAEPTPDRMKYCISLDIEFDIDKDGIRPQYHDEVAKVGDFMKKYPATTAAIEGYADEVGNDDYNMKLSQRRAESVVKSLEENFGIDPARLSAKGYGKTRPIANNATDEGKQKNRRIEAIIDCALDVKEFASPPERLCITLNAEFATDSAEIQPRYYGEVNKVGDYMKKYPTTTTVIEGHTDNIGSSEHNMKLSQQRAENVMNYLVEKFGIERTRLAAKGYGSTRRIAYNNTSDGRKKNRRINAVIDCVITK